MILSRQIKLLKHIRREGQGAPGSGSATSMIVGADSDLILLGMPPPPKPPFCPSRGRP
jgi:hypothetical protein